MTSFVNVCDVISAEKRYACLKIVNNKTKLNMTCVSSHRCLGSPVVRKKEFRLKGFKYVCQKLRYACWDVNFKHNDVTV